MYRKQTSAQLKQTARGLMMGKYRKAISVLLVSDLLLTALSFFTAVPTGSLSGMIIGFLIQFILLLFGCILETGQCSFYLKIACDHAFGLTDLFDGFRTYPNKIIITQVLIRLLTALPLVPAFVILLFALHTDNIALLLTGCILCILGAAVSLWLSLKLSQVYYVLLDFPEYSSLELLRMSWKLMKGNAGRLFYLQVSFLPLKLAGLLSFGIGLLFVTPYQNMTQTLFYLDIVTSE